MRAKQAVVMLISLRMYRIIKNESFQEFRDMDAPDVKYWSPSGNNNNLSARDRTIAKLTDGTCGWITNTIDKLQ